MQRYCQTPMTLNLLHTFCCPNLLNQRCQHELLHLDASSVATLPATNAHFCKEFLTVRKAVDVVSAHGQQPLQSCYSRCSAGRVSCAQCRANTRVCSFNYFDRSEQKSMDSSTIFLGLIWHPHHSCSPHYPKTQLTLA